jgi:antitoxin (DNA-binding transcriptional repressor) of toxin-antitoxin stability system
MTQPTPTHVPVRQLRAHLSYLTKQGTPLIIGTHYRPRALFIPLPTPNRFPKAPFRKAWAALKRDVAAAIRNAQQGHW